ncbi:heat shock protein 30 [Neurospora tetrasperma FGSC 2508]|uniref:Heat shock protein 30 n=1 Tax=Neurospora tetrasperma (strain FGSC 2508 / ATCC MYA-4615 / P0657) TaxID=510951 RepID=F8MZH5_NEUT8|nr:heat shock protein 30 [Neurospora tetrasperma FGSC 2508]EGO52865.1 heat shock protein 30 [Neurospora tetrasperma FGSC 2508]EGZ77699.1 heat shock protein 30 [Neurospora tetrasperma FGSC 2509]
MALFPRGFYGSYGSDPSFTNLFRLLDDFDTYTREVQGSAPETGSRRHTQPTRTFSPKFDVRETEQTYELHGELPGIDRDNVQIEFTDPQTIVIRGRVERNYTAGTPPAQVAGVLTEKGEPHSPAAHHATVEDDVDEDNRSEKPKAPAEKYWVSERSIGEFSRTFSFPGRVDQNAVSASLNNGILTITVPKAKKHETIRIAIN